MRFWLLEPSRVSGRPTGQGPQRHTPPRWPRGGERGNCGEPSLPADPPTWDPVAPRGAHQRPPQWANADDDAAASQKREQQGRKANEPQERQSRGPLGSPSPPPFLPPSPAGGRWCVASPLVCGRRPRGSPCGFINRLLSSPRPAPVPSSLGPARGRPLSPPRPGRIVVAVASRWQPCPAGPEACRGAVVQRHAKEGRRNAERPTTTHLCVCGWSEQGRVSGYWTIE